MEPLLRKKVHYVERREEEKGGNQLLEGLRSVVFTPTMGSKGILPRRNLLSNIKDVFWVGLSS